MHMEVILKSIFHRGKQCIGILFKPMPQYNAALIKAGAVYSRTYTCWLLPRQKQSITIIKSVFPKGTQYKYDHLKLSLSQGVQPITEKPSTPPQPLTTHAAKALIYKPLCHGNMQALAQYQNMLILKGYSKSTIKNYTSEFHILLRLLGTKLVNTLEKNQIKSYLLWLITKKGCSEAQVHTAINALKFYFEKVLGQPAVVYQLPRPKKPITLPKVLAETQVAKLLGGINNLKHKTMIMFAYGCGLRVSEVPNIKIADIDSKRMMVTIVRAKGKKDRMVPLPQVLLTMLREYYKIYKPKNYLFEGQDGGMYSVRSIQTVFKNAKDDCKRA